MSNPSLLMTLTSHLLLVASSVYCGEVIKTEELGYTVYVLKQAGTVAKIAPGAGANVYSIQVDSVEYLHQPPSNERLAGVSCGVPILYPMPNRVRNASFTFGGKTVAFPPNAGPNFIHGLVNRFAWQVQGTESDGESASIECFASFADGTALFQQFPFAHQLRLRFEVRDHRARWTYTVDNREGEEAVPFGFALHPYFVYHGRREQTYLTIPATDWMESTEQLPSGRLVPAAELDFPLGEPMSLAATKFDDVFYGLRPQHPTRIDFRDTQNTILIRASEAFTHLVVWTPDRPFFGIENQTCSTDAHNLYSAGFKEAAHLQVCEPGQTLSGWVEYQFGLSQ